MKKKIPKLRFQEFKGVWNFTRLEKLIDVKSGTGFNASEYVEDGVRLLQIENVSYGRVKWTGKENYLPKSYLDKYPDLYLRTGDIVIALNRPVTNNKLKIAVLNDHDEPSILYQRVGKINLIHDELDKRFIFQLFIKHVRLFVLRQSIGSDQPYISITALYNFKVPLTGLKEQQKIADFLSSVDHKIKQLRRKKELLEKYKKGVMQKLFSQEIRFKDENGKNFPDWEYKELGDISDRITDKNEDEEYDFVLTNSAVQGVVSQTEYFDKSIANKSNLGGYYIVKKNDFVYNPRISSEAPVGPIKRNKLKTGVMSPLYSVFRVQEENLDFFEYFFETNLWHRYMHSVANFGARHDRMNITVGDFQKLPIPVPSEKERERITNFINSVSERLKTVNRKLELAKKFKKGLLQQMFV